MVNIRLYLSSVDSLFLMESFFSGFFYHQKTVTKTQYLTAFEDSILRSRLFYIQDIAMYPTITVCSANRKNFISLACTVVGTYGMVRKE